MPRKKTKTQTQTQISRLSKLKKFKVQIPMDSELHRRFLEAARKCGDMPVATWARMILQAHLDEVAREEAKKEAGNGSPA